MAPSPFTCEYNGGMFNRVLSAVGETEGAFIKAPKEKSPNRPRAQKTFGFVPTEAAG